MSASAPRPTLTKGLGAEATLTKVKMLINNLNNRFRRSKCVQNDHYDAIFNIKITKLHKLKLQENQSKTVISSMEEGQPVEEKTVVLISLQPLKRNDIEKVSAGVGAGFDKLLFENLLNFKI